MDELSGSEREHLLDIAEASIRAGLVGEPPPVPRLSGQPDALRRPGAAFVTVRVHRALNGCIGTMEAREPLAEVVARMAWEAAFADPRLPALTQRDLDGLHIEISVLSPMWPVPAATREQLLDEITAGEDGILLEAGFARATLLPAVWAEHPDPNGFLDLLMIKAGLDPRRWPIGTRAFRYTAEEFGRDVGP